MYESSALKLDCDKNPPNLTSNEVLDRRRPRVIVPYEV